MDRDTSHIGIGSQRKRAVAPRRLLGVALSGTVLLAGCSPSTGGPTTETVVTTVTQTVTPTTSSPTVDPTGSTSMTQTAAPTPDGPVDDGDAGDTGWLAEADDACALAIDEYGSWKSHAGNGAAPEALALGAASAAAHAADAIEALPRPTSREALGLRAAVIAWAAAYRQLATAMDGGTYAEVTAAGDAAQAAADRIRSSAGSSTTSCAAMVDEV